MEKTAPFEAWIQETEVSRDQLTVALKPLLSFGKLIGILPFKRSNYQDLETSNISRNKEISNYFHALAAIAVGINFIFSTVDFCIRGHRGLYEFSEDGRLLLLHFTGFFIYARFFFRFSIFIKLLKAWKTIINSLKLTKFDPTLKRTSRLVLWTVLSSMTVELTLYILKYLYPSVSSSSVFFEKSSGWDYFLKEIHERMNTFLPYHPICVIFILVTNGLSVTAWNFIDVLIILISRAISFKFRALVEVCQDEFISRNLPSSCESELDKGSKQWNEVRREHLLLCSVKVGERLLSPLVFLSFSLNTYSICIQINEFLRLWRTKTSLDTAYSTWYLFHLLLRLVLLAYFGAGLNDSAHKIVESMQRCDSRDYGTEMERLERYLGIHPIGFTGLNCFILTKQFVLVIFSILFTIEIVLIQNTTSPKASSVLRPGLDRLTQTTIL